MFRFDGGDEGVAVRAGGADVPVASAALRRLVGRSSPEGRLWPSWSAMQGPAAAVRRLPGPLVALLRVAFVPVVALLMVARGRP